MPYFYWDHSPGSEPHIRQGKTIFQVATGSGLLFDGSKEFKFTDIKDGNANTALIFAVAPAQSVPWTKPADWQVDMNTPSQIFANRGMKNVVVGLGDASIQLVPTTASANFWRSLIKPDGGEVDWSQTNR